MVIEKDFLFNCGLKHRVSFQEILTFALPVVVQNVPGSDTEEIYKTEKAIKETFANKHFSNPENLDDHAKWFIDTAYKVSLNFLRTGYVQLGKFFKETDEVYKFTDVIIWDLYTPDGVHHVHEGTFKDQMRAFFAISAHRVQDKLERFGWTDGQSATDEIFEIKHARNSMVDQCVECTTQYLPPYAAYCGAVVEDYFIITSMFTGSEEGQTDNGDLEIPTESLFNSVDTTDLEACCFLYEIRHMFDGCFAFCTYLREFNFFRFLHTAGWENPGEMVGLIGISINNFFYNCINLQILSGTLPSPTDISYMCSGCISLEEVFMDFDVRTFNDNDNALIDPNLDGLTIHYAVGAFANCIHLTRFEVHHATWMRIKNCSYMFENCLSLQGLDLKFIDYLQPLKNDNEKYYFNVHEFVNVPEISVTSDFNVILNNSVEHVNIRASLPSKDIFSSEIKVHIGPLLADSYAANSSFAISPTGTTVVGFEHRCGKMFRNCLNLQYIRIAAGLDPMYTIVSDDKSDAFSGCLSFIGFIASNYANQYFMDYAPGDYIPPRLPIDQVTYKFNIECNRIQSWLNIIIDCLFTETTSLMDEDLVWAEELFEISIAKEEFPSWVCRPHIKFNVFKDYFIQRRSVLPSIPFILVNWREFYKVLSVNIELEPTNSFEDSFRNYLVQLGKSYGQM